MPNPAFLSALDFTAQQCRAVLERYPGYQPMYTVGGKWRQEGELWTHWCDGFYPGIYWLLYKYTANTFWRQHAEAASRALESRKYDRDVHDLGFLFFSTYLRWYNYAKDPALRDVLIAAGRTLALRRQMGGYLRSFIGPESLFIDIMMNVGIILWAGNQTQNDCLRQIAIEHARTTRRTLIRADGGTAHEGVFDVVTGDFLRESTHQGHKPESTWSRGQAWALYGFTAMHRLSALPEFLDDARKTADCFLRRRGADPIPRWDFDAPTHAPQPYDSSAAAIAASGLLDLAEQTNDVKERDRYREAALEMLAVLCSDTFLASSVPGWEGILRHGVYHIHKNLGVDESVAWGDHFFVEALVKAIAGQADAAW
jgi:unsaturated chondroitin disaccharide hydrolase